MKLDDWKQWCQGLRLDALVLGCVLLFFVAFFPQVIFGDRFIIAGDAFYYSYPLRTIAWQTLRHGELPLWTPYLLSGYPLLSMAQVAVGYPLTWGYLFLPGQWAEQVFVLAPFLLAPMFTYAYARELGRSRLAAFLAGLAFGYGGMMCGFIANSGILTNGLMWAPLVLLYIERARTQPVVHCLPRAAFFYALSVLAGHAQSYVYVGGLAVGYGLFLSLWTLAARRAWDRWANWRPLAVALGSLLLAAGVAAFQLLESLRAARRSIRSALSYELFGEGSFTPREALLSVGAPLYHYVDTSAYLAPLALVLAAVAIAYAWRSRPPMDVHLWFWTLTAAFAFVLLLGTHTPLYQIIYRVPVLKQFRIPSRHTFEWTLAVSILASYGWDAVADHFARRAQATTRPGRFSLPIAGILLVTCGVLAWLWWRATTKPPVPTPRIYTALPEDSYWLWKLTFTTVIFVLVWWCFRLNAPRGRGLLLGVVLMLACFAEPAATVSCWWARQLSLPAERFQLVSPTTRYLQQFSPTSHRVYTRVGLFAEEFTPSPRLEAPNLSALHGLHNLAGMEPLILERYSRALGGVGPDSVTPRLGFPANDDLFSARSHVLDLLNTTHVVSFAELKTFDDPLVFRDGIGLSVTDINSDLPPGATMRLTGAGTPVDNLVLVTSLANSVSELQGGEVARVHLHTDDGRTVELSLRAGLDTSEWAHERPDVRVAIKHELAPIFDSRPGDAANNFSASRYWTRLSLGKPLRIAQVEIENVSHAAALAIWRATLYDSHKGVSTPLSRDVRSTFWTTVYDRAQVEILQNARALPRAWLVAEAEAVDGEEALHRIRGESSHEFDPQRTALLEVRQQELPLLPGGALAPNSQVRVVSYESNRLLLEAVAPTPTLLILSEIFYPGWYATVDGQPAQIMLTDYLLRGVALPAGRHRIEMVYRAPAARTGALISAFTLLLLCALALYARRGAAIKGDEA